MASTWAASALVMGRMVIPAREQAGRSAAAGGGPAAAGVPAPGGGPGGMRPMTRSAAVGKVATQASFSR